MNEQAALASHRSVADTATPEDGRSALILAAVGDRNLLFSEPRGAIYELNDLAAYVWRSIQAGMDPAGIVRELIGTGIDPDQAESAVLRGIEELRALGTATDATLPSLIPEAAERLMRVAILIAGVAVQLHLSKALAEDVEAVFGNLIADVPDTDMLLCARLSGNKVDVFSPGQPDWSCERSHFIPLLKAQIIDAVLACGRYEVAFHAAALVRHDRAVLLVGSPGAGKTTLAIALAKAGFEVLADDVTLLDQAGRVTGLPFPFGAKASSWSLLAQHWPGITDYPSHCRPDGQTLCYIPLDSTADPSPRRIRSVILLNRQEDAFAAVEELDLACAFTALVADGATRDHRLTASGFRAVVEGLREARCCRLTYSNLMEAVDAVCDFHS